MKKLTQDQAEIIFSLFLAQNTNRKISEFVNNSNRSLEICEMSLHRNGDGVSFLGTAEWNFFYFFDDFRVWDFESDGFCGAWKPFDIMKYISLEDKV